MAFAGHIWNQLKNLTAGELIQALNRDNWEPDTKGGSQHIFWKNGRRVSVHFHPQKTYGAKMLQGILDDTGWTVEDMKRLKLVK